MQLAFIGLGKMGTRMVQKLLKEGHEVVVWNRSEEPVQELIRWAQEENVVKRLKIGNTIENLLMQLETPRVIWSMLPAGVATQSILDEVEKFVEEDDIVIDGGNGNYKDTELRYQKLKTKNIRFLGIGVSGGIIAATDGYPLMVGGDESAYKDVEPILKSLSKPKGGYDYFGEGGSGHFVKMVHNAIEYGYMQAIGEGFGVLDKAQYNFDLEKVAKMYTKNTLISGFMMDRTVEVLQQDPKLEDITGVIGKASGETIWTIEEAKKHGLPIEIIERSLQIRNESETSKKIQNSFAAKMVAALRNAFGGHEVKKK